MPYKDKEKAKEWGRKYYSKNKAERDAYHEEWRNRPDQVIKHRERARKSSRKTRDFAAKIKEFYGCQNPNCPTSPKAIKTYHLDLHHVDPMTKEFGISAIGGCSLSRLVEEINKCSVLCAICHRSIENGDLESYDLGRCRLNSKGEPTK